MSKNVQNVQVTNNNDLNEVELAHYNSLTTKSSKIRYLHSLGWSKSRIAKHLGVIYQHVRNVLTTPLKTQNS